MGGGLSAIFSGRRGRLLKTGQTTQYSSELDDGYYEKGRAKSYTILTAGDYAGTTNIVVDGKTDTASNNCVLDKNTGLMWKRYVSASVGSGSDGKMAWTGSDDDIFQYAAAANAAELAGHSDWRIPNKTELQSLPVIEAPTSAVPDPVAFPSWPADYVWSSSTRLDSTTNALALHFASASLLVRLKTEAEYTILVRGG